MKASLSGKQGEILSSNYIQTVLVCDNTLGKDKKSQADCTYSVTMGASYGQEHSHSNSLDASISASYKEEIDELFVKAEVEMSASLSTGFKWSSSSSSTWSQKTTFTVTDSAPKGDLINN